MNMRTGKIAVFWNNEISEGQSNKEVQQTLFFYLIEKNRHNKNFNNAFQIFDPENIDIFLEPKDVIDYDKEKKIVNIINPKQWNSYFAIFILDELDWYSSGINDLFGIVLTQNLRLCEIKVPIFIASSEKTEKEIISNHNNILAFRGHYFTSLISGIKNDFEIEELDELDLLYCKFHFCDLQGRIRDIYHNKQSALINGLEEGKLIVKNILSQIKSLPSIPEAITIRANKRLVELDEIKNKNELDSFIKQDESVFLDFFTKEEEGVNPIIETPTNGWKVLILEDKPDEINKLKEKLESFGLKNRIHIVNSYKDAVDTISNDLNNFFTIVICDFRIEQEIDGIRYLKNKQGYTFLKWLSKQDRLNEMYVHSGVGRKFLKTIPKHFNVRVNVISKYEITTDEIINDQVQEIIEKGNEINNAISNLPSCTGWEEMCYYYYYYRNDNDYYSNEEYIGKKAREVITQVNYLRETAELMGISNAELQKTPLFTAIKTFPKLGSNLCIQYKETMFNQINPDEIVTRSRDGEKLYLWKNPESKKGKYYHEYFFNKLIARRIVLWLHFYEGIHLNTVYSILMKGEYFNDYFNNDNNIVEWRSGKLKEIPITDATKQIIKVKLAIVNEDFPNNILIEEQNWLKYEMGWDPEDLTDVISNFQAYFNDLLNSFLDKTNIRRKEYSELKERYMSYEHLIFNHPKDIKKAYELLLGSIENPKDKLNLVEQSLDRFNFDDKLNEKYFSCLYNYLDSIRGSLIKKNV